METAKALRGNAGPILITEADTKKGSLILVNSALPFDGEKRALYTPVINHFPGVLMEARASSCLYQLLRAVGGLSEIIPVSGYRSFEEQTQIYQDSLKDSGSDFTAKYVAKPGCSEHETGLAIDLAARADEIDFIRPFFPDSQGESPNEERLDGASPGEEGLDKDYAAKAGISPAAMDACLAFRQLAPKYGFIQRYTKEKESITGIACEPWHFRFVGYPHAELMVQMGFCLEEYIDYLNQFSAAAPLVLRRGDKQIQIFTLFQGEAIPLQVTSGSNTITELSGNGRDRCVATVWNG